MGVQPRSDKTKASSVQGCTSSLNFFLPISFASDPPSVELEDLNRCTVPLVYADLTTEPVECNHCPDGYEYDPQTENCKLTDSDVEESRESSGDGSGDSGTSITISTYSYFGSNSSY